MRAQVVTAFKQPYQLQDIPRPDSPESQDILVRVLAASYCHTDAVFAEGLYPSKTLPRVGCHEFAGEIVELGPSVQSELNLKVGSTVGIPGRAYRPCGKCTECVDNNGDPEGYGVRCTKALNLGFSKNGGFQEYAIVDSRQVAPIPDPLTPVETAPLMCAGTTIWSALGKAGVRLVEGGGKGKKIVISGGGGGLGHLGIQFAAHLGCEVVAVDAADRPLNLAREVSSKLATDAKVTVVDARNTSADQVKTEVFGVGEVPGEQGADVLLILPEAQAALDYGMKLLRNRSVCVVVSFPENGFRFDAHDLVFRDVKIVGTLVGLNREARAMLEFAARNKIRASSKSYNLEELNKLVDDYNHGAGGKLVIDMTK